MAEFSITGVKAALKPVSFELDINDAPPVLTLLINPENLDVRFTSKVTPTRVRWTTRNDSPYILQHHHDELDTMTMTGKSAMFYTNRGITAQDRTRSLAWENIQKLLAIYRNNGLNYNRKPGREGIITTVGRVLIVYDGFIFQGSFQTFSITESEEKPYNYDFTLDYKVTKIFNIRGANTEAIMKNSTF